MERPKHPGEDLLYDIAVRRGDELGAHIREWRLKVAELQHQLASAEAALSRCVDERRKIKDELDRRYARD